MAEPQILTIFFLKKQKKIDNNRNFDKKFTFILQVKSNCPNNKCMFSVRFFKSNGQKHILRERQR